MTKGVLFILSVFLSLLHRVGLRVILIIQDNESPTGLQLCAPDLGLLQGLVCPGFLDLSLDLDLRLHLLEARLLVFLTPTELPNLLVLLVLGVLLLLLLLEDKLKPGLLFAHLLLEILGQCLAVVLVLAIQHLSCLCQKVRAFHKAACHLILVNSRRAVVHELLGVEDEACALEDCIHICTRCVSLNARPDRLFEVSERDVLDVVHVLVICLLRGHGAGSEPI